MSFRSTAPLRCGRSPGAVWVQVADEGDGMASDPLMPQARRFPMNAHMIDGSREASSRARPFVLRHAVVLGPPTATHRTPATRRPIPQTTNLDNRTVDDSYTVPDE